MIKPVDKLSARVRQRLEFIEFRLYWEGKIRRSDLRKRFDISMPQATADFSTYQDIARNNLVYDLKQSTYVSSPDFQPVIYEPDARDYLTELRLIADGVLNEDESRIGVAPVFETVPLVRRRADESQLRKIVQAIRHQRALHIRYQSMSRDAPSKRWITPHALVFDGFRWHVRSWSHESEAFRDFVFARILDISSEKPDRVNPEQDIEWQRRITFKVGPNPKLSTAAKKAIERDYGMRGGKFEIKTRVCLAFYVEKHLGLDLDPEMLSPERQQVILLNGEEIRKIRNEVVAEAAIAWASYAKAREAASDSNGP